MKKVLAVSSMVLLLAGCATLASTEIQQRQLADGSTLNIDNNVPPTSDWGCTTVDNALKYNWAMVKSKAQLTTLNGQPLAYLRDKAVDYANQYKLKANYANIQVPNETDVGGWNVTGARPVTIIFYQCKSINPDHTLGYAKTTSWG